jgi:hypothetical protein
MGEKVVELFQSDSVQNTKITQLESRIIQLESLLGASAVTSTPEPTPTTNTPPTLTLQGNNPANIDIGSTYADLGVTVEDDEDNNLGIKTLVNGEEVQQIDLDTSTSTQYVITYSATDNDGNTTETTRTVIVGTPTEEAEEIVEETTEPEPIAEEAPVEETIVEESVEVVQEESESITIIEEANTSTSTSETISSEIEPQPEAGEEI